MDEQNLLDIIIEATERKKEIDQELELLEKEIFEEERSYLTNTENRGNVLKGWKNFPDYSPNEAPKNKIFDDFNSMAFSKSSFTNRNVFNKRESHLKE